MLVSIVWKKSSLMEVSDEMGKKYSWSREFLDKVIKTYLRDFDPVERCIDRQLSSLSGAIEVKSSMLGNEFRSSREYVPSIEDELIDAIDRKYRWASSAEGVMWALYINGHSLKEIADIFGVSITAVRLRVFDFHRKMM